METIMNQTHFNDIFFRHPFQNESIIDVIESSSSGNMVIARIGDIFFAFDCGVSYEKMVHYFKGKIPPIDFILISHTHQDHISHIKDYQKRRIDIIAPDIIIKNLPEYHKYITIQEEQEVVYSHYHGIKIKAHKAFHDTSCFSYQVYNNSVNIAYIIDTGKIPDTINPSEITHLLVEMNHDELLVASGYLQNSISDEQRKRILKYHLSVQKLNDWITENKHNFKMLSDIRYLHLSNRFLDITPTVEKLLDFKEEVYEKGRK